MGNITSCCTHILLLFLFILFTDFSHAANSSSNSRCIKSEWKALMEFKENLVNDSSSLSSWTGRDCCSWDEITCHNLTGHVQSLQLDSHNFNSTLSPWLFNLSRLEVLMLSNCGFLATIPNMFGKLTFLSTLDLSINSFASVFPDSLCSLANLVEMNLVYSQLQGSLPVCLGNMTSLTTLYLGSNQLSGEIPSKLSYLPSIVTIDLSDNLFTSSIPPIFGNLTQLEYLDVSHNSLTGELSESFFEGLKSLRGLIISGNRFLVFNVSSQWIPPFQIRYLDMDSVFFGTQFPPWLQAKRDLKGLIWRNASISGILPEWCLNSFPNLTYFDLSRNLLTGSLPTFDANISASDVYALILSDNQITGDIPEELCNLKSLVTLSLANNKLTGRIPLCLGNLQKLQVLDLGNNHIFGHVPGELGSLGNLVLLHLNGNKLFGELSSSLQNLDSLITLDLGDNELQGSIPKWIGIKLPKLECLRLESNNFSNEISANLCQLPFLHILNLAHNHLTGTIPPCLGNLSKMLSDESGPGTYINIYSDRLMNNIKGTQMEYSSGLRFTKFISLSSNHLNGEIPAELMNLKGLQSLNLSKNELTGRIPEKIGNLQDLESLDLSMNQLSGTIPQSLAHVDALGYLNLSFNNLAGRIPSGNHFSTFTDASIYEGNEGLCGELLKKSCPGDGFKASDERHGVDSDDFDGDLWIYAGIGPGFAAGFLVVICILYFKDSWRIAYFGFVDKVYDRVWVTFAIKISQIKRKFS